LAFSPQKTSHKDCVLYFPQDPQAGGSWFVVKADGSVFVLLNGADKKHTSSPPYLSSRGIILLEMAIASNINFAWNGIDLTNIEPFTIIAFNNTELLQLRWNGENKQLNELDATKSQIWSSSTLYTPEIIEERERWFSDFINVRNETLDAKDLIDFHKTTRNEDSENGLIINRKGNMLTKNVTQYVLKDQQFILSHYDLIAHTTSEIVESIQ
jgi:hypothetical protein